MSAIYGLYPTPDGAQRAVNNLRAAGIDQAQITIISSEPFEEHEFAHRDHATLMGWIALGGAIVGLLFATWLTRMTELAWPLQTGNMPIVAWWPNLIVIFELTMLGAILATVITLFVSAKLPTRESKLYDPQVSDGKILVGVENPSADAVPTIEQALLSAGVAQLKRC